MSRCARATVARRHLGALLAVLMLAGCSSASHDEMVQDVLKRDPAFKTALDQRDAIQNHVDDLRDQLEAKRIATERQVRALQGELQELRRQVRGQMDSATKQLAPQREALQIEINTLTNHIRTQEAVVHGLKRTIADLERSLHHAGPLPSGPAPGRPLPPTGGALETQLADDQRALQQALSDLEAQQTRRTILQYKLRLLEIR